MFGLTQRLKAGSVLQSNYKCSVYMYKRETTKWHINKAFARLLGSKVHLILTFHILKFRKKNTSPRYHKTGMNKFGNVKGIFLILAF